MHDQFITMCTNISIFITHKEFPLAMLSFFSIKKTHNKYIEHFKTRRITCHKLQMKTKSDTKYQWRLCYPCSKHSPIVWFMDSTICLQCLWSEENKSCQQETVMVQTGKWFHILNVHGFLSLFSKDEMPEKMDNHMSPNSCIIMPYPISHIGD